MPRVIRVIDLLAQDQPIYYIDGHTGHVLTHERGRQDSQTSADNINVGMEYGSFDLAGLAEYMRGLVDGGPTSSSHRTPAVIVEAPVNGTDEPNVRFNAWQFRQLLGRGVHGILRCQAETARAVRAFVESCRYSHHRESVDPSLPSPLERLGGATMRVDGRLGDDGRPLLGVGTRGRGSETTAAPIWGLSAEDYQRTCDPWPVGGGATLSVVVDRRTARGGVGRSSKAAARWWLGPPAVVRRPGGAATPVG